MSQVEITSLSSKGQVVIPNDIRKELGISSGAKLLVLTDGINVLLKPVQVPRVDIFNKLIKESRRLATKKGLKQSDVTKIIRKTRIENSY
jgi:antitoxin PrlF